MAEKMGPIISTNGLVFCVDAANPQSIVSGQTVWKDLTFNTTGGTLVNGVGFSGSGISSALSFDGTNDFVLVSSDQPFTPTNGFSITSWVNPTDITFQRYIEISRRQSGGGLPTYLLSFQEFGDIMSFGLKTTSTYNELDIQIKAGGANTWTSYVGTWDGTHKRIYRNGSNIGQNTQIGTIIDDSGAITNIGALSNFNQEYFRGRISQVQMYDRGLSPFEVYQNYNATKGRYGIPDIVTGGLVLNLDAGNPYSYNPDNTGSTVWTDVSYNTTGGTLVNGTSYTGGTMQFDGVNDYISTPIQNLERPCTFSTWFNFNSLTANGGWNTLFGQDTNVSIQRGRFYFQKAGSTVEGTQTNKINFSIVKSDGSIVPTNGLNTIQTNTWYNYVAVLTTTSITLYENGVLQNTTSNSDTFLTPNTNITLNAGYYRNNIVDFWPGRSSIFQIYNRALTAAEVQQNFNALRGRYGI